jgi:hypothetical protein
MKKSFNNRGGLVQTGLGLWKLLSPIFGMEIVLLNVIFRWKLFIFVIELFSFFDPFFSVSFRRLALRAQEQIAREK